MPKFSIIIPVCDNEKMTIDCIRSIEDNSDDYEIIIVDNGSKTMQNYGTEYLWNKTNLGFPVAVNQGIKEARGEIIIILNNDTIVTPHWLEYFDEHLKNFDMVGPVTNNISGPQRIKTNYNYSEQEMLVGAQIIHEQKQGAIYPWHRLVFFCVAIKKEVIDKIGLLDEQFSPGNFEDDDFCLRAIDAGFKLGVAEDIFIHHIGSATHEKLNINHQNLLIENGRKFQAKWSKETYEKLQNKCLENCLPKINNKKHTLALVMIVKNEEKGLKKAILSCKDFVDEIVIAIDNATTDKTEEIAKEYATTIKHFDWNDDFSAARNYAHEGVKSEWILFLDGHEYVKESPDISNHLDLDCEALLCTIEMENGTIFRNPRIYRNGIQFKGALHELQDTNKIEKYTEFLVKHDRITGQDLKAAHERNEQRNEMTPRIMGTRLKKNRKDARALFHLGLYYAGHGQHKKAIKIFNKYLRISKNRSERWYIFFNKALCQLALNHCFRAFWTANRADNEVTGRWEIAKLKGLCYYQKRKFSKAIEEFVGSFKINTGDQTYKPWKRNEAETWNLIGECFFNTRNYFKAHIAFKESYKRTKNYKFKIMLKKRAKIMLEMAHVKAQR